MYIHTILPAGEQGAYYLVVYALVKSGDAEAAVIGILLYQVVDAYARSASITP